jgi:hypothetical protein
MVGISRSSSVLGTIKRYDLGRKKIPIIFSFPMIFFAVVAHTEMKNGIQIYHPIGGHKCFTNISCLIYFLKRYMYFYPFRLNEKIKSFFILFLIHYDSHYYMDCFIIKRSLSVFKTGSVIMYPFLNYFISG